VSIFEQRATPALRHDSFIVVIDPSSLARLRVLPPDPGRVMANSPAR